MGDEKLNQELAKMTNDIKSVTRAQSISFETATDLDIHVTLPIA